MSTPLVSLHHGVQISLPIRASLPSLPPLLYPSSPSTPLRSPLSVTHPSFAVAAAAASYLPSRPRRLQLRPFTAGAAFRIFSSSPPSFSLSLSTSSPLPPLPRSRFPRLRRVLQHLAAVVSPPFSPSRPSLSSRKHRRAQRMRKREREREFHFCDTGDAVHRRSFIPTDDERRSECYRASPENSSPFRGSLPSMPRISDDAYGSRRFIDSRRCEIVVS